MNASLFIKTPAAPGSKPILGLTDIERFVRFPDASAMSAALGVPVEVDLFSQPKDWIDPAAFDMADDDEIQYLYLNTKGANPVIKTFTLTAAVARTFNPLRQADHDTYSGPLDPVKTQIAKMLALGYIPVPVRALDDSESLSKSGPTGGIMIRTPAAIEAAAESGGGFGPVDRQMLAENNAMLKQLVSR